MNATTTQFLAAQPTKKGEMIVDGIDHISKRFELMAIEINILNGWLKTSLAEKYSLDSQKLTEAEFFLSKSRDKMTDVLVESAQLIKKLQHEINVQRNHREGTLQRSIVSGAQ